MTKRRKETGNLPPEQKPFTIKKPSRREFMFGLGAGVTLLGAGLAWYLNSEGNKPALEITSLPEPETLSDEELLSHIQEIANQANTVFKKELVPLMSTEGTIQQDFSAALDALPNNMHLITTLEEFLAIQNEESDDYEQGRELYRIAFVRKQTQPQGQICFYRPAMEFLLSEMRGAQLGKARAALMFYNYSHEATHSLVAPDVAPYQEPLSKIYTTLFSRIVSRYPELQGYDQNSVIHSGAEFTFTLNNQRLSLYQNVEEAEAEVVGRWNADRSGASRLFSYDQSVYNDIYAAYNQLITRIGGDQAIAKLAETRKKPNGRYEWLMYIADHFTTIAPKEETEKLLFALDLLWAIDWGDFNKFNQMVTTN